jgi:hypothetical protein
LRCWLIGKCLWACLAADLLRTLVRELGQVIFTAGADALTIHDRHSEKDMLVINELNGFLNHRHLRIGS